MKGRFIAGRLYREHDEGGVSGVAPACDHTWTLFCQGCWGRPWLRPYWRVDICVKCYAKREVNP